MNINHIYSAIHSIEAFLAQQSLPNDQQDNWLQYSLVSIVRQMIAADPSFAVYEQTFASLNPGDDCHAVTKQMQDLKKELESRLDSTNNSIEQDIFNKFGSDSFGSKTQRQQLQHAMQSHCNPPADSYDKVEYPDNSLAKATEQTLNEILDGNTNYIQQHIGLSDNIQKDTLDWIETVDKKLQTENPFRQEQEYLDKLKKMTTSEMSQQFPQVCKDYDTLSTQPNNLNFDFYEKKFDENSKNKNLKEKSRYEKVLHQKFLEEAEESLMERIAAWQLKMIDEMRRKFLKLLQEKLEKFKKLEKLMSPIFGDTGLLWDMSEGMFKDSGFDILKKYADLLEKDTSLIEFANILGKHSQAQVEYEIEQRAKVVVTSTYHPRPAQKGQISGITIGNDISSVLPCEMALLKNSATTKLFKLKFAQKQLIQYRYENIERIDQTKEETEEVSKEKKEPKGPVIICVDTSGSMQGTPEQIAKAVTLAICKIAMEQKRKCYLISFSKSIETLDLSNFRKQNKNSLDLLIKFLRMSFWGGTDAVPALSHSLNMLSDKEWENADILMISDFCMNNLPENIVTRINEEKEKKTDFHSLVIGYSGNGETIKCFTHNWYYDMNNPQSARHIIEGIRLMK